MGKHRNFDHKDVFYASWTDALQEFLGNYVQGVKMYKVSSTTVGVKASTGTSQISVGFGGPWRYVSENLSVLVSGSAGTKDIYVVAVTENDFVGAGEDPDETDYDFELRVVNHEATPASVAYYRKLGEVTWDGSAITALKQTLASISGAMLDDEVLSNSGDVTWVRDSSGNLYPLFKTDSVGSAEIVAEAVTDAEVAAANKDGIVSTPSMRTLGTGAKQAAAGNDSRLSNERVPVDNSVTAAKIAANEVGASEIGSLPACRVRKTTDTAIGEAVETYLTFPTEVEDTDSMHSTSSNTGRIVCVTPGLYQFYATILWTESVRSAYIAWFQRTLKAGGVERRGRQRVGFGTGSGSARGALSLSIPIRLVVEDYVEVGVVVLGGADTIDAEHETFGFGQEFGCVWLSD